MRSQGYPSYVSSGLDWIGSVPEGWAVEPLGRHMVSRNTTVSDSDFRPLSVTRNGVVPQLENVAKTSNGDARKLVRAGDFAINSRSDRKGSAGLAEEDGSVSVITTVLALRGVYGRYIHHLLRSEPFQEEYYRYGSGIVADLWSTRWSSMKKIRIPLPSAEEQRAIADFLDRETGDIDAFIRDQEELIRLLQERRAATISHSFAAISSGVRKLPLRYVTKLNPGPPASVRASNLPVVFLPMDAIKEFGTPDLSIERTTRGLVGAYSYIEDGDVAYAKVTPCFENGKGVIGEELPGGRAFATTEVTVLRPAPSLRPAYLAYVLQSDEFRQGGIARMTGAGGLKRVPEGYLRQYKVALPPIDRQDQLILELNDQLAGLDVAIKDARTSIVLTSERRAALVSAAVTGKIDVREHVGGVAVERSA
jgi:type I restriction enzyme S subunit